MADAARRVADLERQLEQLERYRAEYMQSSATAGASMDAVKLQNYRSFLDRLGEAKRQHQKNLDAARAEFDKRRRCGARSASRRSPWGAWWSGSARKSGRPRIARSSAKGTMRRCGYRFRESSGAEPTGSRFGADPYRSSGRPRCRVESGLRGTEVARIVQTRRRIEPVGDGHRIGIGVRVEMRQYGPAKVGLIQIVCGDAGASAEKRGGDE